MTSSSPKPSSGFALGRWCRAVLLALSLIPAGCAGTDVRGSKFPEDDLSTLSGKVRPPEPGNQPAGMSNKAMQIERDLGYGR